MTTESETIRVQVVTERALIREAMANLLDTFPGFAAVPTAPAELMDDAVADAFLIDESTAQTLDGWCDGRTVVVLATDGEAAAQRLAAKVGAAGCIGMQVRPERLQRALIQARRHGRITGDGPDDAGALPMGLTAREVDVLRRLAAGLKGSTIAEALDLSPHTVRTHIQNLMMKLGTTTRVEAILAARRLGLLTDSTDENPER